jgi:hypothetical protein
MSLIKRDITNLVSHQLSTSMRARQDDKYLISLVWARCGLTLTQDQLALFLGKSIPSPESIRRTRQKLQEAGRYLPPKPVQEARQQLAEETKYEMVQERLI